MDPSSSPNRRPQLPPADYQPPPEDPQEEQEQTADAGGIEGSETPSSEKGFPADLDPESRVIALIGGLRGSGKTVLLDAWPHSSARRCALAWDGRSPQIRLEVHETREDGAERTLNGTRRAARTIYAPGVFTPATQELENRTFDAVVTVPRKGMWSEQRHAVHLLIHDPPGEAILHEEVEEGGHGAPLADWEGPTLSEGKKARLFVMVVDAMHPGKELLMSELEQLLAGLATLQELPPPEESLLATVWRKLQGLPLPRPAKTSRLGCDRILVVLTKVDALVSGPLTFSEDPGLAGATPLQIASRLDPLALLVERAGPDLVSRIFDLKRPETKVAVVATSAFGFSPFTGAPLMQPGGRDPLLLSNEDRSQSVTRWTPFGLQEAMIWAVSGIALRPLREVSDQDVQQAAHDWTNRR